MLVTLFGAIAERYGAPSGDLEAITDEEDASYCEALAGLPADAPDVEVLRSLAAELGDTYRKLAQTKARQHARDVSAHLSVRLSELEELLNGGQLLEGADHLLSLEKDSERALDELDSSLLDTLSAHRSSLQQQLLERVTRASAAPGNEEAMGGVVDAWAACKGLGTMQIAVEQAAASFLGVQIVPLLHNGRNNGIAAEGNGAPCEGGGLFQQEATRRAMAASPGLSSTSSVTTDTVESRSTSQEKQIYSALKKLCSTVRGLGLLKCDHRCCYMLLACCCQFFLWKNVLVIFEELSGQECVFCRP